MVDKREVQKQLEFFEGGQNKKFKNKVKSIGLSTDSIEFLDFLQSRFCQELLIEKSRNIFLIIQMQMNLSMVFFNNKKINQRLI